MARRLHPDVVLCDIGLPGMNGYEVARAFRAILHSRPFPGGTQRLRTGVRRRSGAGRRVRLPPRETRLDPQDSEGHRGGDEELVPEPLEISW